MKVSVITPTCDRPIAFALSEGWMARQTVQPQEWIVADGGQQPVVCTQGQRHLHAPAPAGVQNFASNLVRALEAVRGDIVVCWEDDEWYGPTHLEQALSLFTADTLAVGDDEQRYYHLPRRCWRTFQHTGASLSQTALRASAIPELLASIRECAARSSYGVDAAFWKRLAPATTRRARGQTSVGIKGLPGQVGLGIGHRPDHQWTADPSGRTLRTWVGADAVTYAATVGA